MIHVVDIETTGLNQWSNEILTCAIVTLDNDLKEVERNEFRRKPECIAQWSRDAEEVHKITIEQAITFDSGKVFRKNLKEYLLSFGQDSVFVCHSYPMFGKLDLIDYQFIFSEFNRLGDHWWLYKKFPRGNILSTISRRNIYPVESQKLNVWAEFLKIELDHHDAMSDALACAEVFRWQQRNVGSEKGDREGNRRSDFGLFRSATTG